MARRREWCQVCGWNRVSTTCQVCGRYVCVGCRYPFGRAALCTNNCVGIFEANLSPEQKKRRDAAIVRRYQKEGY